MTLTPAQLQALRSAQAKAKLATGSDQPVGRADTGKLTPGQMEALIQAQRKARELSIRRSEALKMPGPGFEPQAGSFKPDPLDTGEPGFMQSLLEPGLQAPKDVLFSTAATAAVPPLAVPKALSFLPSMGQFAAKIAPQVTAAGAGGGVGRATQDPDFAKKDLSELMADFSSGFKEFAAAEATGLGIAGALSKTLDKAFPGLDKQAQRAINYARRNDIPIPSGALKKPGAKGLGGAMHKVSEQTFLGDFVRRTQANKINEFIDLQSRRLAPQARTIDSTAQEVSGFISDVFKSTKEAKDTAYLKIKEKIPQGFMIKADSTFFGAQEAMNSLMRKGKQSSKFGKTLKNMLETRARNKTYDDLDRLRKEANKFSRDPDLHEATQLFIKSVDEDLNEVGKKIGVDLFDEKAKADAIFNQLRALNKIPGLKRFATMKSAPGFVKSFVNETNIQALDFLKTSNKSMYDDLMNARMKQILDDSVTKDGVFDGVKLKQFYDDNQKFIKRAFGKQQAQALENFAKYTSFVKDELKHLQKDDQILRAIASGATGGAGFFSGVGVVPLIATEGTTALITKGLMNPKSTMFKIFTESSPEGINKAMTSALPAAFRLAAGGEDEQ